MRRFYLFSFVLFLLSINIYAEIILTNVIAEGCSSRYFTTCVYDEDVTVRDLTLDDFEFELNGNSITSPQIEILNECPSYNRKVDVVIFLDLSPSIDDEIDSLGDNLDEFIARIGIMDYRICIVVYNGCRESARGILELIRTDYTYGTPVYLPGGPDYWATNYEDFQTIYDVGQAEFFDRPYGTRGSGQEDQYGAMVYFAENEIEFRPDARKVFCLLTDEEPIYEAACSPSYGPEMDDLWELIEFMNSHDIDVIPVTPEDGMFYCETWDPYTRRYYTGYVTLGEETNGTWVDLNASEYIELIRNITDEIVMDSCCYDFMFTDTEFCTDTNTLFVNVPGYGSAEVNYQSQCPPNAQWLVPSPFCNGWSTCPMQDIQILFTNESGMEFGISEIEFEIEEQLYYLESSQISLYDSIMQFTPEFPWENGQTVNFDMIFALDDSGCLIIIEPCSLRIDLSPPVFWSEYPSDGSALEEAPERIFFLANDLLSGINYEDLCSEWFNIEINSEPIYDFSFRFVGDTIFIEGLIFNTGDNISIEAIFYDSPDYEYCEPNESSFQFSFSILSYGPEAELISPAPNTISACYDQIIRILITDDYEVDWNTVELSVANQIFTWDSGNLSHSGDTLYFNPPSGFYYSGQIVEVVLLRADDNLGTALSSSISWTFVMDLEPPLSELVSHQENVLITQLNPSIQFRLWDSVSVPNVSSIEIELLGNTITYEDLDINQTGDLDFDVLLNMERLGLSFNYDDTVSITLFACDSPDSCSPNCNRYEYTLIVEPITNCYDEPDPFTPNGDDYNPYVVFSYPRMFTKDAELIVFTKRREVVCRKKLENISNYSMIETRKWDGKDNNGNDMPPGLYLYIIKQDGKVVCEGTVTLVR